MTHQPTQEQLEAAKTNLERYGKDFYKTIAAKGKDKAKETQL